MTILQRFLMVALALFAVTATPALAASTWYSADGRVAIKGADPVAYFKAGKPIAGKADITHDWMGLTWQFASAANRDAFTTAPEKYAPQYGGYCAWAVSQGYTAKIEPEAWAIVGGKLYLNYSKSIQSRWSLDRSGNIKKADSNWPDVKKKLAGK